MKIKKTLYTAWLLGMLALSPAAFASEEYELTLTLPIIDADGKLELKPTSFLTYYSPLETRIDALTWDPCKAKGQAGGCTAINPLRSANVQISLHAFNAENIRHLDGCYVEIDFSRYKPLPDTARAALASSNEQAELARLAVAGLQKNTTGSRHYVDCELRVKGLAQGTELADLKLPRYLNPVIPACQPYTREGHEQAKAINDQGMDHYRAKQWPQAEESFRRAAEQDCNYFIARTNLASVLSLQGQYERARAVLWRAYNIDPKRTLKKLETDPDYKHLKQEVNFYAAASPIGQLYREYCFRPAKPAEVNAELPKLMKQAGLRLRGKPYTVATRYVFQADFNRNGIADQVYPLLKTHLHSILVVFDGGKVKAENCKATPLYQYDLAGIHRTDPCGLKIFASKQGVKRGIRLETGEEKGDIRISRVVCKFGL